ncbi:EscU/YscU/HrcU family type III secretion system export apparatus switch protein [Fictibacillus iocasae]|uniref:EscU/YscU/HrcU family type III secretion system export apparatus switch protein n=1 Tax=Fictibacillus iocasae TaxID=2715437 RepID=A0ABW2NQX1_9BACL
MNSRQETLKAVALRYKTGVTESPEVIAKGTGMTAANILSRAEENGIPVQSDPSLVSLLSKLEISEQIPPELYAAVAEVFAYVYTLDKEAEKKA